MTDSDAADTVGLSDRLAADYGARVLAVEPGGADYVPLSERHGKPWQLFATWLSPNMEFATVFVGVLGVQAFERWLFPVLTVAFVLAAIEIFTKVGPSKGGGGSGGFLLTFGAAFGYAVGWNPFASDYTRYLPPTVSKVRTGLFAGLGVFVS